jgi:hypothetical protein
MSSTLPHGNGFQITSQYVVVVCGIYVYRYTTANEKRSQHPQNVKELTMAAVAPSSQLPVSKKGNSVSYESFAPNPRSAGIAIGKPTQQDECCSFLTTASRQDLAMAASPKLKQNKL